MWNVSYRMWYTGTEDAWKWWMKKNMFKEYGKGAFGNARTVVSYLFFLATKLLKNAPETRLSLPKCSSTITENAAIQICYCRQSSWILLIFRSLGGFPRRFLVISHLYSTFILPDMKEESLHIIEPKSIFKPQLLRFLHACPLKSVFGMSHGPP